MKRPPDREETEENVRKYYLDYSGRRKLDNHPTENLI